MIDVSVIVPLSESRKGFFEAVCKPSIEKQDVKEIIVIDGEGTAPKKRNKGKAKATGKYLFFCDDDIELPKGYLNSLSNRLELEDEDTAYAYSNFKGIVHCPECHPAKNNFVHHAEQFNEELLRHKNYISTMSLIKADVCPEWDESLIKLQDWDLWLTLLEKGYKGVFVEDEFFTAHYLEPNGITTKTGSAEAYKKAVEIVKKKHQLFNYFND